MADVLLITVRSCNVCPLHLNRGRSSYGYCRVTGQSCGGGCEPPRECPLRTWPVQVQMEVKR